ncbi:peptidylprolyl isomerase [Pontibacillus yanchengensis]|uniref:Foldase protein PrsA n=1 Tax=Pontibacillus yanchengensis Y32 TaxID=1385514 RepID=A0A0A2TGN2_9BACI|nr:peptidylprolyl isomerase [Pontibacillus yanchengensis]KGP73583.1 peptidylprolyl isomerase [Pontibacillus yanchengensis Y32]
MKKLVPVFLAIIAVLSLAACSNGSASESKVVASTENGDVTKEAFYNKLVDQYGDSVLKEMVYDQVLSEKFSVSDEDVQKRLEQMKQQYGDQFQSVLEQNGFKNEEQFKQAIRSSMLKQKAAAEGVEVTDEEVKQYYENMKQEVQASHILVEDKETASEVQKKLNNGGDFAKLAKEYSTDKQSAQKGGDLGYISTGQMVLPFEKAAYNLEVGKVSEPVKSQYGYHIIKVTDKREKEDTSSIGKYEEMKDQLREELKTRKGSQENITEVMEAANVDIKIEDLKDKISFEPQTQSSP